MRWVGHVARMGEMRNAYRIVVGKTECYIGLTKSVKRIQGYCTLK
jgi:hypothetical protein